MPKNSVLSSVSMLTITDIETLQNFEAMFDKHEVDRICNHVVMFQQI
jgi:hypothetical protein